MAFRYVKIYYGPCNSFHAVIHKPQRLTGLKDRLQKLGFRVDLVPVEHVNYCVLEMCGHEIFRCNIQNLLFNMPYTTDKVCKRAIETVLESSTKLQRARSYLWFWRLIEEQIFVRNEHTPKDYWPFEYDERGFMGCLECVDCCGIKTRE